MSESIVLLETENKRLKEIVNEYWTYQCNSYAPTLERINTAHSFISKNWPFSGVNNPQGNHNKYRQGHLEECYICTLLELIYKQETMIRKLLGRDYDLGLADKKTD